MRYVSLIGLSCAGLLLNCPAGAETSAGAVRIGILNDQSGPYADFGGKTSVDAARMAVEDVGGKVLGKSIEVIIGDHQNKPDVASAIARRWFDVDGVSAIAELTNSAVALAVQQIAKEQGKITLSTGPATTRLTNEDCSSTGFHWAFDTYSQAVGTARTVIAEGGKSWFLLVADYAFVIRWPAISARSSRPAAALWLAKSGIRSTPATSHRFCYGRRARKLKSSAWRVLAPIPSTR